MCSTNEVPDGGMVGLCDAATNQIADEISNDPHHSDSQPSSVNNASVDSNSIPVPKVGEEQDDDTEIHVALSVQQLAISTPEAKDLVYCSEGQNHGDCRDGDRDRDAALSLKQLVISTPETKDLPCCSEGPDHSDCRDSDGDRDVAVSVKQLVMSTPETKDLLCFSKGQDWGDCRDDNEDSDEEGWITPENIQKVCEEMGGAEEVESDGIAVGCMTTDYVMQVRNTGKLSTILEMFLH